MIRVRDFIKMLGIGVAMLGVSGFLHAQTANDRKPNIILFLVDDMGWMDSSVYGSTYYRTPNMERLAAQSMVFTNGYSANPLCSPTRASLMTGKYPDRLHFTVPIGHLVPGHPPPTQYVPELPPWKREPMLKDGLPYEKVQATESLWYLPLEEYTIAEAAKANGYETCFLGKWHLGKEEKYWPEHQGFDINIGGMGVPGPPGGYFDPYQNRRLSNRKNGEYITDRLTDEMLAYIEDHQEGPFFVCMWHFAVHGPWGHKEEITKHFRGINDPRGKQNNPIMASMLFSMDESLGRMMDKLEELEIADNTILLFTSDNGGNIHADVEGKRPTNNFPLRGGKNTIYEGGTRVPMLIKWPGVVKPASKSSAIVSTIDFYPTILEMMGGKPKKGQIIDGVSLVPLLKGAQRLDREAYFCHFPKYNHVPRLKTVPATYVRQGDWKLIRIYCEGENFSNAFELYNLKDDIGETRNLASEYPEKVKELDALIEQHLKSVGALVPGFNPAYNPFAERRPDL